MHGHGLLHALLAGKGNKLWKEWLKRTSGVLRGPLA